MLSRPTGGLTANVVSTHSATELCFDDRLSIDAPVCVAVRVRSGPAESILEQRSGAPPTLAGFRRRAAAPACQAPGVVPELAQTLPLTSGVVILVRNVGPQGYGPLPRGRLFIPGRF